MSINTLNESSLHSTLKTLYTQEGCTTETELDGKIYDIVSPDGSVIEIQTQSLEKLLSKTVAALKKKRAVKIVYPLAITKYIETYDESGQLILRRKSPVKKSIYNIFFDLKGMYSVLLKKYFSLDVLECVICERRIKTDVAVQSKNMRRRFPKNWLKSDKLLEEILATHTFSKASDYTALLPKNLPDEFTVRNISDALSENKSLPKSAAKQANIMAWLMSRMNLIERCSKKGRAYIYRIR